MERFILGQTNVPLNPKFIFSNFLIDQKNFKDLNFKLTQSNFLFAYLFVWICQWIKKSIIYLHCST